VMWIDGGLILGFGIEFWDFSSCWYHKEDKSSSSNMKSTRFLTESMNKLNFVSKIVIFWFSI
jgi:hypothetical protein